MDDVIFAGTASRPPRDFAEVSILLERDAAEEGARGESEVTRRIERGAGSAYRIDGRDVRAKDVALAVRRCGDRRALAGAGQPGQDRRGDRRQAGRAPAAARGSGGHFRAARAAQGRRAEAARDRSQSRPGSAKSSATRSSARRSSAARRAPPSATASSATKSAASRRGCCTPAGPRPSARPRPPPPKPSAAADAVERIQQAIAEAQAAQDRANAALTARRTALAELREQGHALAHQLATARARRDTVARRLAELDRLERRWPATSQREEALKGDAARRHRQLDAGTRGDRAAARRRREPCRRGSRPSSARRSRVARSRSGACRTACPPGRDAGRAPRCGSRARRRRGAARPHRAGAPAACRAARGARRRQRAGARAASGEAKAKAAGRGTGEAEARRVEADEGRRSRRRKRATRRRASSLRPARHCPRRGPSMTRLPARSSMAAARRSPACRAEPGYERALAAALGEDADAAVGRRRPAPLAGQRSRSRRPGACPPEPMPRRSCHRAATS